MHASINGLRTEIAAMRKEMDSVNEMALDKLLVEPAEELA